METTFVTNTPTCSRSGQPVQNCQCGGHAKGNGSDAKPTPMPTIDINFAEQAGVDPLSDESEGEVRLAPWMPEHTDDDTVINANERPTPMPVIDLDYDEIAKQP